MASVSDRPCSLFDWQPQPEAATLVGEIYTAFCDRSAAARQLAARLLEQTGTRLSDWIDHFTVLNGDDWELRLVSAGFVAVEQGPRTVWRHPGGRFPAIVVEDVGVRTEAGRSVAFRSAKERGFRGAKGDKPTDMVVRVESVADFLVAQGIDQRTPIAGAPLGKLRQATVAIEGSTEIDVLERHGDSGFEPSEPSPDEVHAVLGYGELFRRRQRAFDREEDGFAQASALIRQAVEQLGKGRTCDLFFAAEREYWTLRNRAARVQKARQDVLGLGWGNHDHHTYRSSRRHFHRLIAVLELLGLECRERFYAGQEAGWGAQVLEHPTSGVVVFADVDMAPEEVVSDFVHQPLPEGERPGTVGLWCLLHGEACLEAGMHHLECQFAFDAVARQLQACGVGLMSPFTDLPYLKQAFTAAENWPVAAGRLAAALAAGAITPVEAERFGRAGAIGSHLEVLQRDQGYRGFNQAGINEIIRQTDPRRPSAMQ